MSIAEMACELGVHVETLRNWRRDARQRSDGVETATTVPSLEEENRRLRRENAGLGGAGHLKKATPDTTGRRNTSCRM